jgi:hypothetical protein
MSHRYPKRSRNFVSIEVRNHLYAAHNSTRDSKSERGGAKGCRVAFLAAQSPPLGVY